MADDRKILSKASHLIDINPSVTTIVSRAFSDSEYDINAVEDHGWSALHFTVALQDMLAIRMLIKHNCKLNLQTSRQWMGIPAGSTPLIIAAYGNNKELVSLLCKSGADCNQKDSSGLTVFHHCLTMSPLENVDIMTYMIDLKEFDLSTENNTGQSYLLYAVIHGLTTNMPLRWFTQKYSHILDLLLQKGVDINLADMDGNTALHHCFLNFHKNAARQIIQKLLGYGGDTALQNSKGQTPLYGFYAEKGQNYLVQLQQNLETEIRQCVTPMAEDKNSVTILHRIALSRWVQHMEIILQNDSPNGKFINAKLPSVTLEGNGNSYYELVKYKHLTALQIIMRKFLGKNNAIKRLIKAGADVHMSLNKKQEWQWQPDR